MTTTSGTFAGGRYTVERMLGRGGMAVVYLAHDAELDRPVAVKVLGEPLASDDEFVRRFRREATTAAGLTHPHVVQVFDTGEDEDVLFIVMEYVDGERLDELLQRKGPLPPAEAVQLASQACDALEYAHAQGVIHRDVKPANILLRRDGILKVADFGIARPESGTQLTQAGTILGTAAYLSPEQARGEPVTPQADVYSLGVVVYQLLTNELPRRLDDLAQLAVAHETPVRPVRDISPGVPVAVEAAVMRSLARDPAHRTRSAAELAAELRAGLSSGATTVPLARPGGPDERTVRLDSAQPPLLDRPMRAPRRGPERRVALAALVVAALLAAVLAFALTGDGDGSEDAPRQPAQVEPVQPAEDAVGQARNLEDWIRRHTRGGDG